MRRALLLPAAAAVLTLAACGTSTAAPKARTVAKPSCDQQMTAWVKKSKPATAAFNKANTAVVRAQQAENVPGLRFALERQGKAATGMEALPIPRCADPAGYYAKWLDRFIAAGDNARSQGGLSGLQLELEPLKGAPALRRKLNAELDQRTQYSGI